MLRKTLTFWIKKFRSVITVAHGMLGNAIQVLERSIVTITFSVKKKEGGGGGGGGWMVKRLGRTITNCFQILSQSKLFLKLSADSNTVPAESNGGL